jgi:hypothetical protein
VLSPRKSVEVYVSPLASVVTGAQLAHQCNGLRFLGRQRSHGRAARGDHRGASRHSPTKGIGMGPGLLGFHMGKKEYGGGRVAPIAYARLAGTIFPAGVGR